MSDKHPPPSVNEIICCYQNGERDFQHSELEDAAYDFRGADLSGADFSHSFIVADFRGACLRGANFTLCNVKTCDFRGADLQDAIFREAGLEATQFADAILDGADFEGAGYHSYVMKAGELPL